MKKNYFNTISMIEHLHRLTLRVMKVELDKMNITDINSVQCFILYNLGMEKITVKEMTTRGYYLGENACYNIRKMTENGYFIKKINDDDLRSCYIKLSDKGINFYNKFKDILDTHEKSLESPEMLSQLEKIHISLKDFWENLARREVRF